MDVTSFSIQLQLTALLQILGMVYSSGELRIQFSTYSNRAGEDWASDNCDKWFAGTCDHEFMFCLDQLDSSIGSWSFSSASCPLFYQTSGWFGNDNTNMFGSNIKGVANPIKYTFNTWQGGIRLKIKVSDDDDFTKDDLVDIFDDRIRISTPGRVNSQYKERNIKLIGIRNRYKTEMILGVSLFCHDHYYSPSCDVYCIAMNNMQGHYDCHPNTGMRLCLRGWEGAHCTIPKSLCPSHPCQNGATCNDVNQGQSFTCNCIAGYTGTLCEEIINECLFNPCMNNATCVTMLNSYSCICPSSYDTTPDCDYHICNAGYSKCQNNGTCIGSGKCICPPGFSGTYCDTDLCEEPDYCQNSGTCYKGVCTCKPGFTGAHCDVDTCDIMHCHGGTCIDGVCICPEQYTGKYCETKLPVCKPGLCLNDGFCRDVAENEKEEYYCICTPYWRFSGTHCENDRGEDGGKKNEVIIQSGVIGKVSSPKQDHTSLIAGLIGGMLALLILILLLLFLLRRSRRKKDEASVNAQEMAEVAAVEVVHLPRPCASNFDNPLYGQHFAEGGVAGGAVANDYEELPSVYEKKVYASPHKHTYATTTSTTPDAPTGVDEDMYDTSGAMVAAPVTTAPPLPSRKSNNASASEVYDVPTPRKELATYAKLSKTKDY